MYEQLFQLKKQPFSVSPKSAHYFPSSAMQTALAQSKMAIDRASGPSICIGGAGLGKTLLLEMLAEDYQDHFRVARIPCSKLSARIDLLQSILFALEQPYRDMSESELRLVLTDYLKPNADCPNGILVLVDDAHWLNSNLLDELRLLSSICHDGEHRCHLVMTGNRKFEEALADPQNDSLNQKIASRSVLVNLTGTETKEYVRIHLRRAGGGNRQFFTDDSLENIFDLTHGVPRMINQLCDQSLVLCAINGYSIVDDQVLNQAWQEVQQFPSLWNTTTPTAASGQMQENDGDWSVIEYGLLDCDQEAEPMPEGLSNSPALQITEQSLPPNETADETSPFMMAAEDEPSSISEELRLRQSAETTTGTENLRYRKSVVDAIAADSPIMPERTTHAEDHRESKPMVAPNESTVATPTSRPLAINPFEETFHETESVDSVIRSVSTKHNLAATLLTRDDIDTSTRAETVQETSGLRTRMPVAETKISNPPYQFEANMFADSPFQTRHFELSAEAPSFSAAGIESYIASIEQRKPRSPQAAVTGPNEIGLSATQRQKPQKINSSELQLHSDTQHDSETAGHNPLSDDKDMLVINHSLQAHTEIKSCDQSCKDCGSATPIGKGKAVMMDYRQLFEQLRQKQS